jgi:hypothetical protein
MQRINWPLSASAPAVTIVAVPEQTFKPLQQTTTPTAISSRPISRLVTVPLVATTTPGAKSLPGKNQSQPILDAIAAASLVQLTGFQSTPAPTTAKSMLDLQANPTSTAVPSAAQSSSLVPFSLSSDPKLAVFPTPTSFITLTRTQGGQEQTSDTPNASSMSQAIFITRSLSTMLSSGILATSVAVVPTAPQITLAAANDQQQRRSRLTPLARTLFIVLGALGEALSFMLSTQTNTDRCSCYTNRARRCPHHAVKKKEES